MKKLLSLFLAFVMTMALAVPAFAADTPSVDLGTETEEHWIMPRISIYSNIAISENGRWDSTEFTATASNGNYIRFWHENTTDEDVIVHLYRKGVKDPVKTMTVPAHGNLNRTYYSYNAGAGTYKIVIEATVSGGDIYGSVNVAQYTVNPY